MPLILVMGISGSGKSTLGEALARDLGWDFLEADKHHPPENIRKMASGIPLTDQDRQPWLRALRTIITERLAPGATGRDAVLACSALRESYRQLLRTGHERHIPIVYLKTDPAIIEARLKQRQGHYMGPSMLQSQLQTLEEPREAIVIPLDMPTDKAVATIRRQLSL